MKFTAKSVICSFDLIFIQRKHAAVEREHNDFQKRAATVMLYYFWMGTQVQAGSAVVCLSSSRNMVHTPLSMVNRKLSGPPRVRPLAGRPAASKTDSEGTMLSRSSAANAALVRTTRLPFMSRTAFCICSMQCASVLSATIWAGEGTDGVLWQAVSCRIHAPSEHIGNHRRADITVAPRSYATHEPTPMVCGQWCSFRLSKAVGR
jgi:hypothetical protein